MSMYFVSVSRMHVGPFGCTKNRLISFFLQETMSRCLLQITPPFNFVRLLQMSKTIVSNYSSYHWKLNIAEHFVLENNHKF
jgi:hypothetical protein